jgi:hypothetical protein
MAKARTDEGCERRLTTLQMRRLNLRSVPVAIRWISEPGSGLPRRRTGVGWSRAVGRDSPHKVEHMAVEPARPGWPVRLSAGSASACSAATDERSGQPARTPTPAGTATDHADIVGLRERNAHRRATEDGRAHEAGGGGFGSRAARIQHRPLGGRLGRLRPEPSRRSPVGLGGERFLRPRPRRDVALPPSPPPSFGREHGRRLRWRASPLRPGLGRFAAAGGRRATPACWRPPGQVAWAFASFAPGERAKSPSSHQVWSLYPGMGTV